MIGRALGGIYKAIGNEFTYALDDVRQKVVEEAWRGHPATPSPLSYEQWSGIGSVEPKGDALGRTVEQPERTIGSDEPSAGLPDPLAEDRPSNLPEREAMATAYARHAEAGPHGLIEIENVHAHQQRSYEQWAGLGSAEESKRQELEREQDDLER
mgnify:CR=1 FL=1